MILRIEFDDPRYPSIQFKSLKLRPCIEILKR
uniref:Uncharacterized protein n=1 Tax=Lepeophtheirus salmonis TaxID=72036 RepID=A0A0K2T3I7_LEPSM